MRPGRGAGGAAALACALVLTASASAGGAAPAVRRIVGGGKANAAGWQFTVALEQKRGFICSGSLIATSQVLTAAHCVKGGKRRQLSVLAGSPWISPGRRTPRIKVTAVVVDQPGLSRGPRPVPAGSPAPPAGAPGAPGASTWPSV